ncbi:MAG: double-strand break repair protein AddB [Alphaproteobacteria bacterium]|nr:double-strand break repair protein AddB [Alphaproteobacteria bacterium]
MSGQVVNIPAGQPFARSLARFLLRETQDAPERLATYKILLPTRRAQRVMQNAFLSESAGKALLLPQMSPLGDVAEEDLSLMMFGQSGGVLDLPPVMPPLRRRLLLARLIAGVPGWGHGAEHALALAGALGVFLDHVATEGLDFSDLGRIVPAEFAAHWQVTLDFLKIVTEQWPAVLRENGVIDGAERRGMLLRALATHWRDYPPETPVIAAGSTGSIPATGDLLTVVAGLPRGMVVLPGLDEGIDDESWDFLEPTHPQYGLKQLLERIGLARDAVGSLGEPGAAEVPRVALAREVMRPVATSSAWKGVGQRVDLADALSGVQHYVCDTQQEEAGVIALLLREALQHPEKTAALVTPDRALAKRVAGICARWGIAVDDSAGTPLMETRAGVFMSLVFACVAGGYDPVALLAMLKHPLCAVDFAAVGALEEKVLRRDPRPSGYHALLEFAAANSKAVTCAEFVLAGLDPLRQLRDSAVFSDILDAHIAAAEILCGGNLWRGDDGNALAGFLSDLREHAGLAGAVSLREYAGVFTMLAQGVSVRAAFGMHPRVSILGQLEARLGDADLMIMGGLNEGSWPPLPSHDPWMSRPMRLDFGLPAPERAIGLAAHDFVQGFCAPHVVMTRAARVDGSPCVPARWLERLSVVLKAGDRAIEDLGGGPYRDWLRMLDQEADVRPCAPPAPCPPVAARPSRVSVTKVETWLRDPYAIYAYYVLKLRKLDDVRLEDDAALRGRILHKILEDFMRAYPLSLPDDAQQKLMEMASKFLPKSGLRAEEAGFWWPRFVRLAEWFLAQEARWRADGKFAGAELIGEVVLDVEGGPFTLHGRADRIDRRAGGYAVIDYKSGGSYSAGALRKGTLPQLPLEALILEKGRFSEEGSGRSLSPGGSSYLGYWKVTGGQEPGKEVFVDQDVDTVVAAVEEALLDLIAAYRDPEMPFLCIPDAAQAPRFNDYAHLARLKEWAALDEVETTEEVA